MSITALVFERNCRRYRKAEFSMIFLEADRALINDFVSSIASGETQFYGFNKFRHETPEMNLFERSDCYECAFVIAGPHNRSEMENVLWSGSPDAMKLPQFAELTRAGVQVFFFANGHESVELFVHETGFEQTLRSVCTWISGIKSCA